MADDADQGQPSRLVYALTAAAVLVWAVLTVESPWAWPAYGLLAWAWGGAVAVDLVRHELPDRLTLPSFPAFLVLLLPAAAVNHEWRRFWTTLLVALGTAFVLFVLAFIHPSGFGLGDVKLGLTTGAALAWVGAGSFGSGWAASRMSMLGIATAFFLVAVASLVLISLRRATRTSEVAFGPFMVLGVLVTPVAAGLLGWA